jgi:hypothetical protein
MRYIDKHHPKGKKKDKRKKINDRETNNGDQLLKFRTSKNCKKFSDKHIHLFALVLSC